MLNDNLSRRRFLQSGMIGSAAAIAPLPLWAKEAQAFPATQALLDGYVNPGKLAGALAVIGKGAAEPSYVSAGKLIQGGMTAVGPGTIWRLYSMTKPITGMAAMMLVGEGKMKLDQPIADFIPEFATMKVLTNPSSSTESVLAKGQVTVRNLLTHTGGLGYILDEKSPLLPEYARLGLVGGFISRKSLPGLPIITPAPSLEEFGKRLASLPLMWEPSTRWHYSCSLELMGRVIEVASGMPFDSFLQQRIFDPLGMIDTGFRVPASKMDRLSTNYFVMNGLLLPIDVGSDSVYLDKPALALGGGGLAGTGPDYDRFLAMLLGKGTLNGTQVMGEDMVALGMSNLLPDGVKPDSPWIAGQGFGAGGRVTLDDATGGSGKGTFGWAGAAGTVGFVDPTRGLRIGGYAQYFPPDLYKFQGEVGIAAYKDMAAG